MHAAAISSDEVRRRLDGRTTQGGPVWLNDSLDIVQISFEEIAIVGRSPYTQGQIDAIASHIQVSGLLTPCEVRRASEDAEHGLPYELVDGLLRYQACQLLGFAALPCRVVRTI